MATNSNIEWTDSTWNPVAGCAIVSAGVACFVKQLGAHVVQRCSNCGKNAGHCPGGMVDACGPTHAMLAQEAGRVRNSKGSDMGEWPEDLRVREFPQIAELSR